ncbi:integrase RTL1 [Vairimorpha necatrix]|uniref:Integrase RTL1 n=1 Tax=Vairimorpha necatrix TaxID=6039 RepID=A0AAX4JBR0_9MICR
MNKEQETRRITNTRASSITGFIENLCRNGKRPEEIISDNGREFANEEFRELCRKLDITHRKTSIESHKSNGRVERVIGTLRESVLKMNPKNSLEERVMKAFEIYNNSYHEGLRCTPFEAVKDNTGNVMLRNGPEGDYSSRFKKRYRDKFVEGQRVRVAKSENLKGIVCPGNSYVVKLMNGRLVKKRHYDLKDLLRVDDDVGD